MNLEDKVLINGRLVSVIFTYHDDNNSKDYVAYTDETKDETGKLNVYYGSYKTVDGNIVVSKLESKEEEVKIFEIIKTIIKEEK